ncbi:archaetidylserine decarboxylase [Pseudomonadales bacterium]|nr:archaetidylserine decarboxylase [Pseudomonadales bacterium]MDB4362631.1 archaetidylserine decarboxylase [Pseudomonadales bacterium]MDB4528969.1 archaetidylserine decarboxylase [Pseudomonadales bacterium]
MLDRLFILLQHCMPQQLLSRLTGLLADIETQWIKNFLIKTFIAQYKVDMSEAQYADAAQYTSFNEFFTRSLKSGLRPVDPAVSSIVSPADGVVSEAGLIDKTTLLQAKGQHYDLQMLLGGDAVLAKPFENGSFATIYLSPKDYHRVHMPAQGTLLKSIYVPGELFSVNQTTANYVPQLFARNERLICFFDGPNGAFVVILVGALIVAGIETVWSGQVAPKSKTICTTDYSQAITLNRGDEMGRFKLGSTVILLFPEKSAAWSDEIIAGHEVKMGSRIGSMLAQ